mgnify:CR=1 FL=1
MVFEPKLGSVADLIVDLQGDSLTALATLAQLCDLANQFLPLLGLLYIKFRFSYQSKSGRS